MLNIICVLIGPIEITETNHLYSPIMGEKPPDDLSKYYLESLLELMVNQVIVIFFKYVLI